MRPGDEVAGRYRLDELQGHGPMSEVWRAHDDTLDRTVALKMLSPTADLGRFRREAQAVAALAHENVVRVYDYGEDEAGRSWRSSGCRAGHSRIAWRTGHCRPMRRIAWRRPWRQASR